MRHFPQTKIVEILFWNLPQQLTSQARYQGKLVICFICQSTMLSMQFWAVANIPCSGRPLRWRRSRIPRTDTIRDTHQISLLFHLGKVTENVIANISGQRYPPMTNQFAYMLFLGMTDAAVKFTTNVINVFDNKVTVSVRPLLLGFSKVFDKYNHTLLLGKCPSRILNLQSLNSSVASSLMIQMCLVPRHHTTHHHSCPVMLE